MTHKTTVYEEVLMSTFLLGCLGLPYKAVYLSHRCLYVHRKKVLVEFLSEDVYYALSQTARIKMEQFCAVAVQGKLYVGIYEYYPFKGGEYVIQLRSIRLQELPSCGDVEEEVLYAEVTSCGTRYQFLTYHLASCYRYRRSYLLRMQTCLKHYLRYSSYRGKSLTAETHSVQTEKVVGRAYLRRSMTFKRQSGIGFRHSLSVVNNLYQRTSRIDNDNLNILGTSINSILHQFLYH